MNADSNVALDAAPQTVGEDNVYYAGRFPQKIASPEAAAAMGDTPNELGYYRSRFDGKLYAKVYVRGTGTFSDGTPMVLGDKRYFEVMPIAWYPFAIGEGKRVLVSRQVLFTRAYDDRSNDWSESYIREELQNFALSALDAKTKARIAELPLDNDCVGREVCHQGHSRFLNPTDDPWCVQAVTWDGVFLFSHAEWQGLQNEARPFAPTDYAKAMGAVTTASGFGTGWLRTADSTATRAATFGFGLDAGVLGADTGAEVTDELGVVPVVSVRTQ